MEMPSQKSRTRWRRCVVAVCVLAAAAAAWRIARYYLDVNQYRAYAEKRIEEATGLPAKIGALDLGLFPSPHVEALDVSIGAADFRVDAGRIDARAGLIDLAHGRLRVGDVALWNVAVHVPGDVAAVRERVAAVAEKLRAASGNISAAEGRPAAGVARILARGVVYWGAEDQAVAAASFYMTVLDPLAAAARVTVSGQAFAFGNRATFQSEVTLTKQPRLTIQGQAALTDVDIHYLAPGLPFPETTASLSAQLSSPQPGLLGGPVKGRFACGGTSGLSGPFTAEAWWDTGSVVVNTLRWDADGLSLEANVTRAPDGAYACKVARFAVTPDLLARIPPFPLSRSTVLTFQRDATVECSAVLLGYSPGREPRFVEGTAKIQGLSLVSPAGENILANMRVRGGVHENVFTIDELTADGMAAKGTLAADFAGRSVSLDASGRVQAGTCGLARLLRFNAVQTFDGELVFDRVAGTFAPGRFPPADLSVEGKLRDGRIVIATSAYQDTLAPIAASFATEPGAVRATIAAESLRWGTLDCAGAYAPAEQTFRGLLKADVKRAGGFLAVAPNVADARDALLRQFGASEFEVTCALSQREPGAVTVSIARRGAPSLDATLVLARTAGAFGLGSIDASAQVMVDAAAAVLPPWVDASGPAKVTLSLIAPDASFSADIDLADASVSLWRTLHKGPGDSAGVRIACAAQAGRWEVRNVAVRYRSESVPLRCENGVFAVDRATIALAPVSGLLPPGMQLSGAATVSLRTAPLTVDAYLDAAGAVLGPDAVIDAVTGPVTYAGGTLACSGLHVEAAGSDAMLTARWAPAGWNAEVDAQQLNADAVKILLGAIGAVAPGTSSDGGAAPAPTPGELKLRASSLTYRRGRLAPARAIVARDASGIHVRDIFLQPNTGSITGTVDIPVAAEGGPRYAHCNLRLDEIDLRVLDELVYPVPREFYGVLSGNALLDVPIRGFEKPIEGTSGHVTFTARNGSFGKLGFATKMLTVLKTVDVFRLRMPSLRDEGLTYDTCAATLDLDKGVVNIPTFTMNSPPMTAEAVGVLDFPGKASSVRVQLGFFGAVSGLVENVPVIGAAVGEVEQRTTLNVQVQGSPYDPDIHVEAPRRVEQLKDAARSGGEIVKDAASSVIDRVFRR